MDDSWAGFLARMGALLAPFVFGMKQLRTVWFFVSVVLSLATVVEVWWSGGLGVPWAKHRRRASLGRAMAELAPQPNNPILRVRYARALLESGAIASGMEELERALELSDEGSRKFAEEMPEEAKQEFVSFCPSCRSPNPATAKPCRHCLKPYRPNPLLGLALETARPVLRRARP